MDWNYVILHDVYAFAPRCLLSSWYVYDYGIYTQIKMLIAKVATTNLSQKLNTTRSDVTGMYLQVNRLCPDASCTDARRIVAARTNCIALSLSSRVFCQRSKLKLL